MTTLRTSARVSLVLSLAGGLTLAGCATSTARLARDGPSPLARPTLVSSGEADAPEAPAMTIRFDNQATEFVRVYLVDEKQQWLLGRVERGASTSLKIPRAALAGSSGWMRLSVVPDQLATARSAGSPHVATMGVEPVAAIIAQRWTFSPSLDGGQLTALPLERAAVPQ